MKILRPIFFLLVSWSPLLVAAQSDTVRVYYNIENPRFFGAEARSFFSVNGLSDKALEKKVNDSIKDWFYEKASLALCRPGDAGLQERPYPTPTQRKYKCANPCAIGAGYVLITQSDSVSKYSAKEVFPTENAGVAVCAINAQVVNNKLVYIGVTGGKHDGAQNKEVFFDLRTGRRVSSDTRIRWKAEKKDSLFRAVQNHIQREKANDCSSCMVTMTAPDSASMPLYDLLQYYKGRDAQVEFAYSVSGKSGSETIDRKGKCAIPLREIRRWLSADYFAELDKRIR